MTEQRPVPCDIELEKSVLGALMIDSEAIHSVVSTITHPNFFYNDKNKKVWEAIQSLFIEDTPIDTITVNNKLLEKHPKYAKELALYIVSLTGLVGSSANVETWAIYLKELYLRRRMIGIATTTYENLYNTTTDVFDVYDTTLGELNSINEEINRTQYTSIADIVGSKIVHLKEAANTHTYITGITTGLSDLDRVTMGFQPTDLVIIAARPGMGKTALAIDISRKQAKQEIPVAIFSLEMSAPQLIDRIIAAETTVPLKSVRKGGLKADEWQRFDNAIQHIRNYPIHICDKGGLSINEICSIAKSWKQKFSIRIIYVDYLQLVSATAIKGRNREQEISEISRRLKQLAKELSVPVIAISQLSRACESRTDKRPMLSDLRESGSIEQDADMVIFPFRQDYYSDTADKGVAELIIAKHRNGEQGMVTCFFDGETQRFLNDSQNQFSSIT